jgi:methionyl-tRNA synthetase
MPVRRILVTSALPYANGPIHLGHLVEYIQTDVWVRFQKLRGNECVYVCADDTHGTAIMISAKKAGVKEEVFIARMSAEHQRDFAGFQVAFDNYGSTHSEENRRLCQEVWAGLQTSGLIKEKEVTQLFDPVAGQFLADRFVKGTCPNCKSPGQYGDNCDKCGATYTPADLIDPKSTLSGATPEFRTAKHVFVELEKLHDFLNEWTQSGDHLQPEVALFLKNNFLSDTLRDWDISRPGPYFGFEIPGYPGDYWYVWFDAPIGYVASTAQWCARNNSRLEDWWKDPKTEIHHFIGKDITYFHTLFWPGMLKSAGFNLPAKVHIHGFLTVDGEKMSKTKGTFIKGETYLKHLDPAFLRYYYAAKLGPRLDDLDLNVTEFENKVNSDLVGKVVNLASRSAKFVQKTGLSAKYPDDGGLFATGAQAATEIAEAYENCDFARAMRIVMELADRANAYVDQQKPWTLKDPAKAQDQQAVCTVTLNLFRQIVLYLAPVLPDLAEKTRRLLGAPLAHWDEAQTPQTGTPVAEFQHLMKRIDSKDIQAMIDDSKETPPEAPQPSDPQAIATDKGHATASAAGGHVSGDSDEPLNAEPLVAQCSIEDFQKIDLRVARVLAAEEVPDAKKLLKLTLSLGGDDKRTVFAGIKAAYKPEQLVGRLVVMVANLAPRQMKFGLSEGMVTAAGAGGAEVFLLGVDDGAKPGHRVH